MKFRLDDYIDADMAYLAGLIIARGTLELDPQRRLIIQFPYSNLEVSGIKSSFDQETSIRLGLNDIRERIGELLDTDIQIIRHTNAVDLVVTFVRNSMIWRNILLLTNNLTSYRHFSIPPIFFDPELPIDWKREFIKGYGDAAGNIRKSNIYTDGRYRVRLDVLNYPTNWKVPVQLCHVLQEQLEIPVQLITWGHPNMGRDFREHQLNIFADVYLEIGFSFDHKSTILKELADVNRSLKPDFEHKFCHGVRKIRFKKPQNDQENNSEKLDPNLVGKHFNGYWQICKKLGCKRKLPDDGQSALEFIDEIDNTEDD